MNIILFKEGESFFPSSDERCKHIRKVLKLKEGDSFRGGVVNGFSGDAVITSLDDEGVSFSFTPVSDSSALRPLTLVVAQVRPICMRRILREAVSLGVGRLILPVTDLGEKSYLSAGLYTRSEYEGILLDGAMQSGKTGVPETVLTSGLEEALSLVTEDKRVLLDNVIGTERLCSMDLEGFSVALAVGPERGWSDRERALMLERGFIAASLGDRILRTETAAVSSVALALGRMGF